MPNLVCVDCGSKDDVKIVYSIDDGMKIALCRDCRISLGLEHERKSKKSGKCECKEFIPLDEEYYYDDW